MKRIVKALPVFLVLCMVCGCTDNKGDYGKGYFHRNQPVELTIAWTENNRVVDTQNTPVLKKAQEWTNISLKNVLPKNTTDWKQAQGKLIATGKEPDIMHMYTGNVINQYVSKGVLRPLDDLIEEYAPNLKRFFKENPELKKSLEKNDGKIYHIPAFSDGDVSLGWFIRKDWLDALGLEMPETTEEYYRVLKAFKTQDPNGNGIQDEIPYFNRNAGVSYDTSVKCLYSLWNTTSGIMEKNGKIAYGACEPEFIAAIKEITKWYQEGLIDPEIYTRGNNARDTLLSADIGGSTYDWFGSTAKYNDILQDTIDGFSFVPMPPPSGQIYDSREKIKDFGWGISKNSERAVDAIRYMDFWFSEEGRILANYGIEGESYDMVDGKPVLKSNIINAETSVVDVLNEYGSQLSIGYQQDFEYEKQWLNKIAVDGMEMYKNNGYIQPLVKKKMRLTQEQRERVQEIEGTISGYVSEMQQRWILGIADIDATYNEYLSTIHKMGVNDLISIYQNAYDQTQD